MSDFLEELINKHSPDKAYILSLVDDYTLFCYYLEQDVKINQAILSPLRDKDESKPDVLPSFVIFPDKDGGYRFFDHGTGESGDIFYFIKRLYNLNNFEEICARISEDFGLGILEEVKPSDQKIEIKIPPPRTEWEDVINYDSFSKEGIAFWNQYRITDKTLKEYNVNQVKYLMLKGNILIKPASLAFSYRIGTKHKVYQPYEKLLKFRNNFPREYVEGYYQLMQRAHSSVLFITKSMKDVMVFREMKLDAIAPKAENQVIPEFILERLRKLYPWIFLVFDDDEAGRKGITRYNFKSIWIPREVNIKDTADYCKKYGIENTKQLIKKLIS